MPSITPNLRLSITNRETNKPFLNWRLGIDGPDDSNMIKLDKAWGDMKTMVDGAMAAVGHAYKAETVADMTDHDKSYVYVGSETGYTNGNWYYWDEDQSAWVSGGVYNATALQTDDTLKLEGEAADAKATGEMIVINGDSSNGTRINITTTDEDIEIPTMEDVEELRTQYELTLTKNAISGDYAAFSDGIAGTEISPFIVNINSAQGSSGWTAARVTRCGKNLLDPDITGYVKGKNYQWKKGVVPEGITAIMSFHDKDTTVDISDIFIGFTADDLTVNGLPTKYRWCIQNGVIASDCSNIARNDTITCSNVAIYPKSDDAFNRIFARYDIQVEIGTAITDFEPYAGDIYNISFPSEAGTVLSGVLNLTEGTLSVGSTTPVVYTLDPVQITVLTGHNTVWADCGSVEIKYAIDLSDIDAEVAALKETVDGFKLDTTLTHAEEAADAKATGDAIAQLKGAVINENMVDPDDFDIGSLTASTSGWSYSSAVRTRVRTKQNVTLNYGEGIKIGLTDYNGYRYYLGWRVDGEYFVSGWLKTDYVTTVQAEYVMSIARDAGSEVDLQDKSELLDLLFIKNTNALGYRVEELENGSKQDIITLNNDIKPKIIQGLRRQNESGGSYSSLPKVLSLLHFSDIHGDGNNLARINEFRAAYAEYIDDTICTGDMVFNYYSDGMEFWKDADDILLTIGNHDTRKSENWEPGTEATMAECYNTFISPYVSNWNVQITTGTTYYYKDYPESECRLIVLDPMLSGNDKDAQLTWLESTLNGAKTLGYIVVIAEHYPAPSPTKIDTTFTSLYINTSGIAESWMAKVDAFINGGGLFACWLCGHIHKDSVQYNANYPKQLFIAIANAQLSNGYDDSDRVMGDKSQDVCNMVFVDKTERVVKIVRVGCDRDHYLRHKGTLCIDVKSNPTVIYND